MQKELGSPVDIKGVKTVLKQALANVFRMEFVPE